MNGLQKLPNLFGECTITENLDGLTAAVDIRRGPGLVANSIVAARKGTIYWVRAVAGKRYVDPNNDNHGFGAWVWENADELVKLGPGRHVGRWYGKKINRTYGLDERRFALVNYGRWATLASRPACTDVLPLLYNGVFRDSAVANCLRFLYRNGSYAVPGFPNPYGLIVFHHGMNNMFRVPMEHIPSSIDCWCDDIETIDVPASPEEVRLEYAV